MKDKLLIYEQNYDMLDFNVVLDLEQLEDYIQENGRVKDLIVEMIGLLRDKLLAGQDVRELIAKLIEANAMLRDSPIPSLPLELVIVEWCGPPSSWREPERPIGSSKKDAIASLQHDDGVVLYVAGEESASQIKIRAERLKIKTDNLLVLEETDVDAIIAGLHPAITPSLVIVDSIQTMTTQDLTGTAGSVGQVRECAARLISAVKPLGIPMFLVGHVTKEGTIAGPKVLEHAVDTILNLEGEKYTSLRLLRTTKNRFGPTDEVGLFEMKDTGLVATTPVMPATVSQTGSCLSVTMEGTRPMFVEIQALVTSSPMPNPRRAKRKWNDYGTWLGSHLEYGLLVAEV